MQTIKINNMPSVDDLWAGIGGHFDSLGQILNEFIDNSISNFSANQDSLLYKNIIIELREIQNDSVEITIEDTGTGIKKLDEAFTLGNLQAGESPLNEHGFGMKHALASANPNNDSWIVCTRTQEDVDNNQYKCIQAPYKINDFTGSVINTPWPGRYSGTGTYIKFVCTRFLFNSIANGVKGGVSAFSTLADILFEDIGFIYANIIQNGYAQITLHTEDCAGNKNQKTIGAVLPDFEDYLKPQGSGSEIQDLGNGPVTIEYKFGRMKEKASRESFDNETTRKYYKKSMSSSGVELRVNGRLIKYNLFKEIWGIEKHNSYNYLLVSVNLKSQNKKSLPQTRTSKNGFREGDPALDAIYQWILKKLPTPEKDVSLSDHETDMFEEVQKRMQKYLPKATITTEMKVFKTSGFSPKDLVRIDLYKNDNNVVTIYEGKKEDTTSKDVYQLRMYWDGLVFDGIKPTEGVLVGAKHPQSVQNIIQVINSMQDANGNNYNFSTELWQNLL